MSILTLVSVVSEIEGFECLNTSVSESIIPVEGEDYLCEHS